MLSDSLFLRLQWISALKISLLLLHLQLLVPPSKSACLEDDAEPILADGSPTGEPLCTRSRQIHMTPSQRRPTGYSSISPRYPSAIRAARLADIDPAITLAALNDPFVAFMHESLVSRDTLSCTSRGNYKAPHMIRDAAQPTRALSLLFADDVQCHGVRTRLSSVPSVADVKLNSTLYWLARSHQGPQTEIARPVDRA
ncbi:uncharacterized protein B0H18DRAFT_1115640 [Fomitopsis serialis]|uniref:uncharacterized protein n=1 Tax=Fomitopsis serialis TaxID=139415 RepID=UPI002008DCDD|nr:uncharacterized protein B0H18DRAFT_1115640 [Neoantrodia serialis]KAH9933003.1 hypothetical protein B0H18DRAFT_1115640 [Neoantrodia serialis]